MGVLLASVSWNYPFHNILGPILAALASGNAVIVKPSENVAFSTTYYVQCIHRILEALKLPTSLVTLVLVHPPLAPYLTKHPLIKHVTFIGSEGVGRKVMVDAATNLTPVTLELGGKDPAILLKSTKVKDIASVCMRAVFQSAGQNCIGIERFIVHESLVEQLLAIIVPRAEKLRCGSWLEDTPKGRWEEVAAKGVENEGVDFGAMISNAGFDKLEVLIKDAVKRGATVHTGGQRFSHPKWPAGHYFQPTVISGVTSDMPIAQTELFAPVFLILAFSETQEAVDIANGTSMGLGSSVFGNDKRDVDFVKSRMVSGMVNVNDVSQSGEMVESEAQALRKAPPFPASFAFAKSSSRSATSTKLFPLAAPRAREYMQCRVVMMEILATNHHSHSSPSVPAVASVASPVQKVCKPSAILKRSWKIASSP